VTVVGGVEAGGTKWVCVAGTGPDDLHATETIPTTTPEATLGRVLEFFARRAGRDAVAAVGVASFGPLDLDGGSPTFGWITTTPKRGWQRTDVAGPLRRALGVPVAIDTDVNAAALAEHRWGAARGVDPCVYVTVGSGIGGGALVHGRLLHGVLHPEMGHVPIPHDRRADPYAGCCPYHGDCWEGLASAVALRERWGTSPEQLPADHAAWPLEARYLALGLASIVGVLAPRRIVLGGGVMQRAGLLAMVRAQLREILGGYLAVPDLDDGLDTYLVAPALGAGAGVLGALALARDVLAPGERSP
jgi:fructokinase